MKTLRVCDITLREAISDVGISLTFKEKLEIARMLDRIGVSVIELGELSDKKADTLLIKSIASAVSGSVVAVSIGLNADLIPSLWSALQECPNPRFQVCAALSTSRMEYVEHIKADRMKDVVSSAIADCRRLCEDVEFIAEDATRTDPDFLADVLSSAIAAGAGTVTVCDSAGVMLPDELRSFIDDLRERVPALNGVCLGVGCSNALNSADASAAAAILSGAGEIKAAAWPVNTVSLEGLSKILTAKASGYGVTYSLKTTELGHVLYNIARLCNTTKDGKSPFEDGVREYSKDISFSRYDSIEEVMKGIALLGYDLDESDKLRVWKAFRQIVDKKSSIDIRELEVIIASETMQVPAAYTLENYAVTTGKGIDIIAHVKLRHGDELLDGLSLGDGPIDAAFLAIEKITGTHYELDDFQLQAITEGREAMGQTIVKLRSAGGVYSGRGISTDIVASGIQAYLNALNKIVYEEENN